MRRCLCRAWRCISTRAPTGGATETAEQGFDNAIFLLAPPREGRRSSTPTDTNTDDLFLLAPPREGRHAKFGKHHLCRCHFYSRPHGRGDRSSLMGRKSYRLFLLAPPREGRRQFSTKLMLCFVENCRKITRFFTRYSPYVREIFQKAAKIKRIFARTFREIMYGKGRR